MFCDVQGQKYLFSFLFHFHFHLFYNGFSLVPPRPSLNLHHAEGIDDANSNIIAPGLCDTLTQLSLYFAILSSLAMFTSTRIFRIKG